MKKEYWIVVTIFLFFLAYVLHFLAGNVNISVQDPSEFFEPSILSTYPLTVVEILSRSVGILLAVLLLVSEIDRRPFIRAAILMTLSMLGGFYAIQQLTTSGNITPIYWTLAIAYAAVLLIPFAIINVLQGILKALFSGFGGGSSQQTETPQQTQETNV